jgi:hypothetical protein
MAEKNIAKNINSQFYRPAHATSSYLNQVEPSRTT